MMTNTTIKILLIVWMNSGCIATDPKLITIWRNNGLILTFSEGRLTLQSENAEGSLHINMAQGNGFTQAPPISCKENITKNGGTCLRWDNGVTLCIDQAFDSCQEVRWSLDNGVTENKSGDPPVWIDCVEYQKASWYGGMEQMVQEWPVQNVIWRDIPYVTTNGVPQIGVAEPYWLNSDGTYFFVDDMVPLFVDSNNIENGSLCFIAKAAPPYRSTADPVLIYHVCQLDDPRQAQMHAVQHFLGKPSALPDVRMVQHPIWSTWVQFKKDINQSATLEFAQEIVRRGFNNSQIEIDDDWETCYGSARFNPSKFPDVRNLTDELKDLGFRVTLWVHPFINTDCPEYKDDIKAGYFVSNATGWSETKWWDGMAGLVDFTKTEAVDWFVDRRRQLLNKTGIDGFKFDAGEVSFLVQNSLLNLTDGQYPKRFTTKYVEMAATFGGISETRVAHRSQRLPIYLRMFDKDSGWTVQNGLASMLTTLFLFNLDGYPFVLPDMVGGNAYETNITKELFIRWIQANTFMPTIQLSKVPWDFDQETVDISKKFTSLHFEYSGKILDQMRRSVETGEPVNAPVWWIDPNNTEAHSISTEYLLSEDILVAPVLEQGAIKRDVFLPRGNWKDPNQGVMHTGPIWLRDYPAGLATLPYFIKDAESSLSQNISPQNATVEPEVELN